VVRSGDTGVLLPLAFPRYGVPGKNVRFDESNLALARDRFMRVFNAYAPSARVSLDALLANEIIASARSKPTRASSPEGPPGRASAPPLMQNARYWED
jgi:hypothetical protein